ncbi:MAG: amidohydrolase family protein, partial [Anaerolineae bacterium]|nr:amidohydrolase family protein [Anaerolineae bacterium]
IVAATRSAAQCVGLGERLGTIEAGKWADVLVVREDPLQNIRVLAKPGAITLVLKGGKPVVREGVAAAPAPLAGGEVA